MVQGGYLGRNRILDETNLIGMQLRPYCNLEAGPCFSCTAVHGWKSLQPLDACGGGLRADHRLLVSLRTDGCGLGTGGDRLCTGYRPFSCRVAGRDVEGIGLPRLQAVNHAE